MDVDLSSKIRINAAAKLLSKPIPLANINETLISLFVDRTKIDTSLRRLMKKETIRRELEYKQCMDLNDEDSIKWNKGFPKNHKDVSNYKNLFIPFNDGDA